MTNTFAFTLQAWSNGYSTWRAVGGTFASVQAALHCAEAQHGRFRVLDRSGAIVGSVDR